MGSICECGTSCITYIGERSENAYGSVWLYQRRISEICKVRCWDEGNWSQG
jgi:hypothetical protein